MTRRISAVIVLTFEESDADVIETTGAEVEELSAIVKAKPFLSKCGELVSSDARRRRAGSR